FRMPRSRSVSTAIIWGAQVRATFEHLARYPDLRLAGVIARGLRSAARIFRGATGFERICFVSVRPPIGGPFPDVADHVVDTVTIGRKRRYGRGAFVAIGGKVLVRENPLPSIGHVFTTGDELVAPAELGIIKSAARGKLPLSLGR